MDFEETLGFNEEAKKVLEIAQIEAVSRNQNFVGSEHLLLGITRLGGKVIPNIFAINGVSVLTVDMEAEKQVGVASAKHAVGNQYYTPRVRKIISGSRKEAKSLVSKDVCPEHILLAILQEKDGIAANTLKHLGLKYENVRDAVTSRSRAREERADEWIEIERIAGSVCGMIRQRRCDGLPLADDILKSELNALQALVSRVL